MSVSQNNLKKAIILVYYKSYLIKREGELKW